ncbi:MAG: HD domain-containing phosphohydrolase [Planctomycetota bacterium]|jgi:putative nucleotidyltransferase with HDIG domain
MSELKGDLLRLPETVIVVDDEALIRELVIELLRDCGVHPIGCSSVEEVRRELELHSADLIISDIMMPKETGIDLLRWCRENEFTMPFILITGFADLTLAAEACNLGAFNFLQKPVHRDVLMNAVESALASHRLKQRQERDRIALQESNVQLRQEVIDAMIENQGMFMGTLSALATAIDARDPYTHAHSRSVADLAWDVAIQLGLDVAQQELIHNAGLVHDIGKIAVPEPILQKPGRLTEEEFCIMQSHPARGAEILKPVPMFHEIVPLVCAHHERMDGKGYPHEMVGEAIPLGARILAACDTWNAMTTDRPYRKAMEVAKATAIVREVSGTQLDGEVVEAMLAALA